MPSQKIRIKLKAYDHNLIDQSAERIVETRKAVWCQDFGPDSAADGQGNHHRFACNAQVQGRTGTI